MRRGNPQEPEIEVCGHLNLVADPEWPNGTVTSCLDCGEQLEERSWHPDGLDVPNWALGAVIVGGAFLVLLVVGLVYLLSQPANGAGATPTDTGPVVTPTTYGPPGAELRTVPNPGLRPYLNPDLSSLPVVQ